MHYLMENMAREAASSVHPIDRSYVFDPSLTRLLACLTESRSGVLGFRYYLVVNSINGFKANRIESN